jgi:hypothetical protein
MSKGSRMRPRKVSSSTFSDNWDAVFGKQAEIEPQQDNDEIIDDKQIFVVDLDVKLDEIKKEIERLKSEQHI